VSDFFAVAGVSAVLKWLLSNAIVSAGVNTALPAAATISALSPDLVPTGGSEVPTLNLFMYYASFNAAYRNDGLPAKDSSGLRLSNPPLALDLHYLVSAYGKNEFDPEILLAWAMQMFHENPILPRQTVQNLLAAMAATPGATPEMTAVANTTLADQVELIKIAPEALSNEEISKLWMAFNTHYRPTTSYKISVVLIQETRAFKSNLPVQTRNIKALPSETPVIDRVTPASVGAGNLLTLTGRYFVGDSPADTMVAFDDNPPIAPDSALNASIQVKIPAALLAGVRTIRVIRNVQFGTPADPHAGLTSSPAQFLLMPTITDASPIAVPAGTTLSLGVTPAVGRTQTAVLYLGDNAVELDARPPSDPATSTTLKFSIPADFPHPATVPIRVQVDRVQSKITLDTNPASITFGQFLPQAKVT
jgi:hypothetical protein